MARANAGRAVRYVFGLDPVQWVEVEAEQTNALVGVRLRIETSDNQPTAEVVLTPTGARTLAIELIGRAELATGRRRRRGR